MKINQIIYDLFLSSLSIELLGKWFVLLACGFSKRFFLWRTQKTWNWNRKTNTQSVTHRILERKKIELPKKQSFGFVILWQIQVEKKADFLRYWKRARYEKQSRGIQKTRRKSGKGERGFVQTHWSTGTIHERKSFVAKWFKHEEKLSQNGVWVMWQTTHWCWCEPSNRTQRVEWWNECFFGT